MADVTHNGALRAADPAKLLEATARTKIGGALPNRRQSVMSEYTTSQSIACDRAPIFSGSASEQTADTVTDTSGLHGKMMLPGRSQRAQALISE